MMLAASEGTKRTSTLFPPSLFVSCFVLAGVRLLQNPPTFITQGGGVRGLGGGTSCKPRDQAHERLVFCFPSMFVPALVFFLFFFLTGIWPLPHKHEGRGERSSGRGLPFATRPNAPALCFLLSICVGSHSCFGFFSLLLAFGSSHPARLLIQRGGARGWGCRASQCTSALLLHFLSALIIFSLSC